MPLTGKFTFVFIPCNVHELLHEIQASKSGGLEQDALLRHVKHYFANNNNNDTSSTTTTTASMTEYDMMTSVNITAVTVPTKENQYTACSIYSMQYDSESNTHINRRATDLVTACGHIVTVPTNTTNDNDTTTTTTTTTNGGGGNAIYGNAFCGRAHDDETQEWVRLDMYMHEMEISSDWCRLARTARGGGGSGSGRTSVASLSNLTQQITNQSSSSSSNGSSNSHRPMEIVNTSSNTTDTAIARYGMDGIEPVVEAWGTWIQSTDDVELKMMVPKHTTSKLCQIQFHTNRIKVVIHNTVRLEGTTYDPIAIDECTYTIQDADNVNTTSSTEQQEEQRELCITLGKVELGRTWMYVAK
jgi:CS domain